MNAHNTTKPSLQVYVGPGINRGLCPNNYVCEDALCFGIESRTYKQHDEAHMRGEIGEKPAPTWREGPQIDLGIHGHYVNSSVVVEWAP